MLDSFFFHKLATTETVEANETQFPRGKEAGNLLEAGTSCRKSYTEINKTIILDPTNIVKLSIHNHNVEQERYIHSAEPFYKLCTCVFFLNVL